MAPNWNRWVPLRVYPRRISSQNGGMDLANLMKTFLDGLPEHAVFLLDIDGHVLSWNNGARNLLGYEPDEAIGRHYASLCSQDAAAVGRPAALLAAAVASGHRMDVGQHRHKNGSLVETTCLLMPLHDAERTLFGFGCLLQEQAPALGSAESATRADDVIPFRPRETVLVVDDDDMVRAATIGQLTSLGYTVVGASNGPDALRVLEENEAIDMLFTDVVMPGGMHGGELAREARRQYPGLKVLFTSGYFAEALMRDGRLEPGFELLVKPYSRNELARKVREVLRARV